MSRSAHHAVSWTVARARTKRDHRSRFSKRHPAARAVTQAYDKAMKDYQRARLWLGAPKFYGAGPWAVPVAIGVQLIGHIRVSSAQAALERATERLEHAEAQLLASKWAPPPLAAAAAPAVSAPPSQPPPPPKDSEPVFNHPCPYCGAGNTWQGRRDQIHCNSCKKVFRIRYAR